MTSSENNTAHDFWQHHIAQWQAAGLSQASYRRGHSLPAHQFSYWKRKFLMDAEPVAPGPKTGFTRVQVAAPVAMPMSPAPVLSLCFRDGAQLTGIAQNNRALVKQLLEVLR